MHHVSGKPAINTCHQYINNPCKCQLPVGFGGELSVIAPCLCKVDGKSLSRRDTERLKGDESFCKFSKPRNDPCLTSMLVVAFGLSTAKGFSTFLTGTGSEKIQFSPYKLACQKSPFQ